MKSFALVFICILANDSFAEVQTSISHAKNGKGDAVIVVSITN